MEHTEVTTFRMSAVTVQRLRKEARKRHLSVNALMNEIVNGYFDFHSIAENVGMMPLPKRLIKEMISMLDTTEISKLAKLTVEYDIPDLVYMKKNKFNRETLLECFLCWTNFSSFPYQDTLEGELQLIIIQHNMGLKWSEFIAELLKMSLNNLEVLVSFKKLPDVLIVTVSHAHSR